MTNTLTRRRFLSALAASVVAAGAPLPPGFPEELVAAPQFAVIEWMSGRIDLKFDTPADKARAGREFPELLISGIFS